MRTLFLASSLAVAATGCLDETRYITPDTGAGVWAFAVDETTPPFLATEDGDAYLVEQEIRIPFREPTQDELNAQYDVGALEIPWATLPWLYRHDFEIQINYTISNLSPDREVEVAVTANGMNEFHQYVPGVQIIDDELVADFANWERLLRLAPGERRTGTIREEEMDEAAVDLATVVNGAPNSNLIVHPQNHSAVDPRSRAWTPAVIPALIGVRVGMRVQTGPGEPPPPMLMEATLRVRDVRHVLVQGTNMPWAAPQPAIFTPIVPMEE